MRTPEGWEKVDIDKYLESIDAYIIKPATFGFGGSGAADRVCCIGGTFWSIEVKREGKKPTAIQMCRIREVRAAGGQATWGVAKRVIAKIEKWRRKNGLLG